MTSLRIDKLPSGQLQVTLDEACYLIQCETVVDREGLPVAANVANAILRCCNGYRCLGQYLTWFPLSETEKLLHNG